MKRFICFVIILIAFVCFTGCTQQAVPEAVPTQPITIPPTVATVESTPAPTPEPTKIVTTVAPAVIPTQTPQTKVTIFHIRNNTFVPTELTVLPGTGITWVNDDSVIHTVKTIGNATGMFNSGDIDPGSQWSYTFGEREGRYDFSCSYHPDMKGTVIVMKGASIVGAPPLQETKTP